MLRNLLCRDSAEMNRAYRNCTDFLRQTPDWRADTLARIVCSAVQAHGTCSSRSMRRTYGSGAIKWDPLPCGKTSERAFGQ